MRTVTFRKIQPTPRRNAAVGRRISLVDPTDTLSQRDGKSVMMPIFELKKHSFVLWYPLAKHPVPRLIIGQFKAGNPPTLANERSFDLALTAPYADVWTVNAADCGLQDGAVYHYWFEVTDTHSLSAGARIRVTDPTAYTVDWRLVSSPPSSAYTDEDLDPASVIKFQGGRLVPCDPGGETFEPAPAISADKAVSNNRMVIYELPTSWSRINVHQDPQMGVGTFRDVMALVDPAAAPANFTGVNALRPGRSHLQELGVNALELLPIADSWVEREWGYAPSNYFAPDHSLGFPTAHSSPTANTDLVELVRRCHAHGVRFFIDVVMGFGTRAPMENVNFPVFHIIPAHEPQNPEAYESSRFNDLRDNWGGKNWRYALFKQTYNPIDGHNTVVAPARQFMKAYLLRWLHDFGVDGIRVDSVNNIANWDFIQEFKDLARQEWKAQGGTDDRFLVIGEELAVPKPLLYQNRLDALWNEPFREMVRYAIEGKNWIDHEPSFEWTVRKMIDCRLVGFVDGAQAINYVGSHDVGNFRGRRLYNQLQHDGIHQTEERIKLAFVCLLTAVGIPMIFAGDEFADQHDLGIGDSQKQLDAVNFARMEEPWRRRVFDYVARLVKFRTSYPALAINETDFIHVDFNENKRVVCWRRGVSGSGEQVVVVANFSDYGTPHGWNPSAEYRVPNWPGTPHGKKWREITQERDVPWEWVAREPLFPWEAKVYALVNV